MIAADIERFDAGDALRNVVAPAVG